MVINTLETLLKRSIVSFLFRLFRIRQESNILLSSYTHKVIYRSTYYDHHFVPHYYSVIEIHVQRFYSCKKKKNSSVLTVYSKWIQLFFRVFFGGGSHPLQSSISTLPGTYCYHKIIMVHAITQITINDLTFEIKQVWTFPKYQRTLARERREGQQDSRSCFCAIWNQQHDRAITRITSSTQLRESLAHLQQRTWSEGTMTALHG